jgi:hypothetical protein
VLEITNRTISPYTAIVSEFTSAGSSRDEGCVFSVLAIARLPVPKLRHFPSHISLAQGSNSDGLTKLTGICKDAAFLNYSGTAINSVVQVMMLLLGSDYLAAPPWTRHEPNLQTCTLPYQQQHRYVSSSFIHHKATMESSTARST